MNAYAGSSAFLIAALVASGCSNSSDTSERPNALRDGGARSDNGEPKRDAALSCPTDLPGPPLVEIPVEGLRYCIDAREVTQAQYQAFVDAMRDATPEQHPECGWNDTLVGPEMPLGGEDAYDDMCPRGIYDPERFPDNSVVCVDWCDAWAYCRWAGKRLCGPLPGRSDTAEVRDAFAETEWRYACTNGGTTSYPYGDEYIPGVCVDDAYTREGTGSAGSETCVGLEPPYSKVRDLVGSVKEWTALCERGSCSIEGGALGSEAPSCTSAGATTPSGRISSGIGFRCCADAVE